MTSTITFTGFAPTHPAARDFSLWRHMPRKNREEDVTRDLRRFINCLQEVTDLNLIQIDRFVDLFDMDECTDLTIDDMLQDMGNPFEWSDLVLTPIQRRKLLGYLIEIYRSKGTRQGIENTILFLLGVDCAVVDYAKIGWILGVDELGDGSIAQIGNAFVGPYDFTAIPATWTLNFSLQGGPWQEVTLVPGDFLDPTAATAAEIVLAIGSRLAGAGAYVVDDGSAAILIGGTAPFPIVPGNTLLLKSQGVQYEAVFDAEDIDVPGMVPMAEAVKVLTGKIPDAVPYVLSTGELALISLHTGVASELESVASPANTAAVALGFGLGTVVNGMAGERLYVYSEHAGDGASIELTTPGLSADIVLGFMDAEAAVGGAILAPSDSRTLYSFDIELAAPVSAAIEILIRRIAEYMKPAHTHLVNIRVALPLPWPEGWEIGVDQLGESTELV